jgi:hypothetical protein
MDKSLVKTGLKIYFSSTNQGACKAGAFYLPSGNRSTEHTENVVMIEVGEPHKVYYDVFTFVVFTADGETHQFIGYRNDLINCVEKYNITYK